MLTDYHVGQGGHSPGRSLTEPSFGPAVGGPDRTGPSRVTVLFRGTGPAGTKPEPDRAARLDRPEFTTEHAAEHGDAGRALEAAVLVMEMSSDFCDSRLTARRPGRARAATATTNLARRPVYNGGVGPPASSSTFQMIDPSMAHPLDMLSSVREADGRADERRRRRPAHGRRAHHAPATQLWPHARHAPATTSTRPRHAPATPLACPRHAPASS